MRFDWYTATKQAIPKPFVEYLSEPSRGLRKREFRPRHGYAFGLAFDAPDGSSAQICYGGSQESALVEGAGPLAAELATVIRDVWPEHKVTRADVCEDMREPGLFDVIAPQLRAIATESRVVVKRIDSGDTDPDAGRTWYFGSPSSAVRSRLYEKGKQYLEGMADEDRRIATPALRDWIRFEVQVRPDGEHRWECAQLPPERFFGASRWSQRMAAEVFSLEVERLQITAGYRQPDYARAVGFMVTQYHKALHEMVTADFGGDWGQLGQEIGRQVDRIRTHRQDGTDQMRTLLAAIQSSGRRGTGADRSHARTEPPSPDSTIH